MALLADKNLAEFLNDLGSLEVNPLFDHISQAINEAIAQNPSM